MSMPNRAVQEMSFCHSDQQQQMQHKIEELTCLVRQMAMGQQQQIRAPSPAKLCGICSSSTHPTDACPTLQEEDAQFPAYAAAIYPTQNQYQQQQQSRNDPFSNTYNPGWKDHPNLRYGNASFQQNRPPFQQQPPKPMLQNFSNQNFQNQHSTSNQQASSSSQPSLEELVKQMAQNTMQFQQRTESTMQNLQTQIGQLATTVGELKSQGSAKLPSQSIPPPKANVSAILLRSDAEIPQPEPELTFPPPISQQEEKKKPEKPEDEEDSAEKFKKKNQKIEIEHPAETYVIPLPFPNRMTQSKRKEEDDKDKEILETFSKVEVNIPLLEVIKQMPTYSKFLKELCTRKRNLQSIDEVILSENVAAILQPHLPEKFNDPGTFEIPCTIGNNKFEHALIDLGASINVMPMSIYTSLRLGPLKPTRIIIQLANKTNAYPAGVIEDVLVQVKELIFPVDFYILSMGEECPNEQASLILGRPFLKTARTKIDVHAGTLSMEVGDIMVRFNILEEVKQPREEEHSVFTIDVIEEVTEDGHDDLLAEFAEYKEFAGVLKNFDGKECSCYNDGEGCSICAEISEFLRQETIENKEDSDSAIDDFQESNLDEEASKSISEKEEIVSPNQEDMSWHILREYKEAIGWTLADIEDPFDPFKHPFSTFPNSVSTNSALAVFDSAVAVSAYSVSASAVSEFAVSEFSSHASNLVANYAENSIDFVIGEDADDELRRRNDLRIAIGALRGGAENFQEITLQDHEKQPSFQANGASNFHVDPG